MAEDSKNKPTRRAERIGKYEILGHVATGGMGVVYKARDSDLDRLVALKVLPPDLAKTPTTLIRFKREAAAAAQLRHENIVQIFEIGEARGTYYIAFEFIEGTDLQDYINRQCKLDAKDARDIMVQAARALAHAHEQHVVHRDIKPSNFLLTYKDSRLVVKLTDFGLAIRLEDNAEFRLTKDRSTVGTVDYMSPEQATDSRSVDIRSDIYSLGCTFYHMLAGQAPFSEGSLPERILQHMQNAPPDLREQNKLVPKSLVAIINRMLEKRPADRYQTPAELLKDLERPARVARSQAPAAKLERHDRDETGAQTDEFDKVQPSEAQVPATVEFEELPQRKKAQPSAKKTPISDDSAELAPLEVQPSAKYEELPQRKKAQPSAKKTPISDDSAELAPLEVQPSAKYEELPQRKKAQPCAKKTPISDDSAELAPLEVQPSAKYEELPQRKKAQPSAKKTPISDEAVELAPLEMQPSSKKADSASAAPGELPPRKKTQPGVGKVPINTESVELAPLEVQPSPKKAAPPSDDAVDLAPFKMVDSPKPRRRTDPAMKAHVEPAAATTMRVETDEIEKPRPERPKRKSANSPVWMYVAGGGAAYLGLILVFAIATGNRPTPNLKKQDPPPVILAPRPLDATPVEGADISPNLMGVPAPEFTLLDPSSAKVDRAEVRKDYVGSFGAFPDVPANSKTFHVSRLAPTGPGSCHTLAEALAQTEPDQWALIEIADNGPIYVSALPVLPRRQIILRGAAGFHPLLAWEMPNTPNAPRTLFSIARGSLILDNLDIVMKAADDAPATVFDLGASDFFCRNCSFSLIGKPQREITLLRRHGPPPDASQTPTSQTWLKRCYVRGPEVSVLSLREASTKLLVEESLIVGQQQPLIQMRGGDDDSLSLYCVRSTMATSQVLLRWQAPEGKRASPRISARVLDSILSRDDAKAPLGDMVHLVDEVDLKNVNWRAANCIYAGWKRLLASSQKSIASNELEAWQQQWDYKGPDRALADPWPSAPPSALETQPASTFLPASPVAFEAVSGAGALGAVIGWLPSDPDAWAERAYEPKPAPAMPPPSFALPVIDEVNDGLYHGERLDLNKVDLGKYLQDKLQRANPAPRIVLYLTGTGVCQTSSLRVKGVEHLVLFFVPTRDPTKALTLELNPAAIAQRTPIIEMAEGHLELIGARVHLSPITLVPHILSLQDASLTLTRCRLEGPLVKATDTFKSLISISNGDDAPTTLLIRDSLLVSSKTLIQLRDNVQLKAQNSVFLSFADGVQIDADGPIRSMTHLLDHNTFAVRHAVFNLRQGKDFEPAGSVSLHAVGNAFLRPFAEEFDKGALLRGAENWTALGHWHWHGQNNVYDGRQFAFYAAAGKLAPERQTLKDWQQAWGPAAEQRALSYDGAPAGKAITLDTVLQFDRLSLPPQLRGDPTQPPPGANLVGLGLVKKKG